MKNITHNIGGFLIWLLMAAIYMTIMVALSLFAAFKFASAVEPFGVVLSRDDTMSVGAFIGAITLIAVFVSQDFYPELTLFVGDKEDEE